MSRRLVRSGCHVPRLAAVLPVWGLVVGAVPAQVPSVPGGSWKDRQREYRDFRGASDPSAVLMKLLGAENALWRDGRPPSEAGYIGYFRRLVEDVLRLDGAATLDVLLEAPLASGLLSPQALWDRAPPRYFLDVLKSARGLKLQGAMRVLNQHASSLSPSLRREVEAGLLSILQDRRRPLDTRILAAAGLEYCGSARARPVLERLSLSKAEDPLLRSWAERTRRLLR